MNKEDLIKQMKLFRDKAFCHYTHNKAESIYREIIRYIPSPYKESIDIEWAHVKQGHGYRQACTMLDDQIKKCIDYMNIWLW